MKTALQKLGYKIITDRTYLASASYCVRGAVYVKSSSHTVCGLDNGVSYKKTLEKAGIETPRKDESMSDIKTHRVVSGDTLSAIAIQNGTTVAKIVAANKNKYPKITANYIVVGWDLSITQ